MYTRDKSRHRQSGVTLVELIIFIVIVSVGLTGVLSALNISITRSADPLRTKQALAIAEGLLEEIQLKNFSDPDGTNSGETRATWDNVTDFDVETDTNATTISTDLLGNSYAAMGYTPTVLITNTTLGPTAASAFQILVTVSFTGGSVSLTGFRANY